MLYEYEDGLYTQASEIMLRIGLKAKLSGYKYLRDAICIVCKEPKALNSVYGMIYYPIALKYNKKAHCIERAMRNAIETAWTYGNIDAIEEFFGYTVGANKGKPTSLEFIAQVSEMIRVKDFSYLVM